MSRPTRTTRKRTFWPGKRIRANAYPAIAAISMVSAFSGTASWWYAVGGPRWHTSPCSAIPTMFFAGVCRFHGDCLEGLAPGPAISARNLELQQAGRANSAERDIAITAFYLAQMVAIVYYCFGSERVVLGGGVMKTPAS